LASEKTIAYQQETALLCGVGGGGKRSEITFIYFVLFIKKEERNALGRATSEAASTSILSGIPLGGGGEMKDLLAVIVGGKGGRE